MVSGRASPSSLFTQSLHRVRTGLGCTTSSVSQGESATFPLLWLAGKPSEQVVAPPQGCAGAEPSQPVAAASTIRWLGFDAQLSLLMMSWQHLNQPCGAGLSSLGRCNPFFVLSLCLLVSKRGGLVRYDLYSGQQRLCVRGRVLQRCCLMSYCACVQ